MNPQLRNRELVIYDREEPCPYLSGARARTPFRLQLRSLAPADFDDRLREGDRRAGNHLYRTQCPECQACQPIRIPVGEFRPTKSQQRAWRRGVGALRTEIGPPECDARRIELFNEHARSRRLARGEEIGEAEYRAFLVQSCCNTLEFRYWLADRLIGVAIADRGGEALSAVYCYYAADAARYSPGKFSIMRQLEYCRREGLEYLYLGFYVVGCGAMRYKVDFRPHERLIAGVWRRFDEFSNSDESTTVDV